MQAFVSAQRHGGVPTAGHRRSGLAAILVALLVTVPAAPFGMPSPGQRTEPYVLLWPDTPENPRPVERRTEVGLVYTPEALSALTANMPADVVPPRIAQAMREGTPIVVMWEFPRGSREEPQTERPYHMEIAERSPHMARWMGVQPIWIQQDAGALQQIDQRIAGRDVGVMAAFPPDAFVAGRLVFFHSHPKRSESGSFTRSQRWGAIE